MKLPRSAANPFVHARALAPEEAIDRPSDIARIIDLVEGGHNATLYAPRRMGKTSLLHQVRFTARERDMPTVFIDFGDVLSERDVTARLEHAVRGLPGSFKRLVDRELGSIAAIHGLLDLPQKIAEQAGQQALVVFDEFQALIALNGMDGVVRSHIQHHTQVSYVFSGSEPTLLRELFEDRARPLYGQATMLRLERLDFHAAHDFVEARFTETGKGSGEVTAELVHLSEGHPQRLMLLAHHLWDHTPTDRPAGYADLRTAHDAAMRAVDTELEYLWDSFSANERRVIAALASDLSPYTSEALAITGLATASSAQRAVDILEKRAIIERDDDELRVVDPLVRRWARRRGAARTKIFILPNGNGTFRITDGESLAFTRAEGLTIDDAQAEADRIAATSRSADIVIFDTDDPNDLPIWTVTDAE